MLILEFLLLLILLLYFLQLFNSFIYNCLSFQIVPYCVSLLNCFHHLSLVFTVETNMPSDYYGVVSVEVDN